MTSNPPMDQASMSSGSASASFGRGSGEHLVELAARADQDLPGPVELGRRPEPADLAQLAEDLGRQPAQVATVSRATLAPTAASRRRPGARPARSARPPSARSACARRRRSTGPGPRPPAAPASGTPTPGSASTGRRCAAPAPGSARTRASVARPASRAGWPGWRPGGPAAGRAVSRAVVVAVHVPHPHGSHRAPRTGCS